MPVIFSFVCVLIEGVDVLPVGRFKSLHDSIVYREVRNIFVDGYKFYFIGAVGVAMFAHYISPAILLYLTLVFYVAFYKLPLLHRNEHLKKGYVECALLLLMSLYLLFCIFEISF